MSVFRANPNPRTNAPARRRRITTRPLPALRAPEPAGGVFSHAQPKSTPVTSLPFSTVRNITAAAKAINLRDPREVARMAKRRQGDAWQAEAWEYYDAIGEIKYAFTLVASTLSRVRLYAGQNEDPSVAPKPVNPDDPGGGAAIAALRRLDSAFGGQPGLLRDAALNMCVPGECYLVQIPANAALGIAESWDIRSTDEVEIKSDGTVNLVTRPGGEDGSRRRLPKDAFIARIWRPHPRFSDESDSSMRGLLDACAELMLLNKTFRATARSRLNAGLLYLPDGLSVAAQADGEVVPDDDDPEQFIDPTLTAGESEADDDDFEEALIEAMTTPIADEESAAAVVPLLVRGPADLGEKLRLIQFERSFDPALAERADRVLDRIMQGLDVPKDVVSGLANVKYCMSEDTEILTRSGWAAYHELTVGDEVYTLNHETGLAEWQPVQRINVFPVEREQMLSLDTTTHSSLSTMDHRWPTIRKHKSYGERREWSTSATLRSNDRIMTSVACADLPREPKYSDDMVELLAWFYTEGCYSPRLTGRNWSGLSQSMKVNPEKVERIRAALTREFGPSVALRHGRPLDVPRPTWREGLSRDGTQVHFHFNHELTEIIRPFFSDFKNKILRLEIVHEMTRAQLELFVAVSMWADGHGDPERRGMVWQGLPERLDAAELACALLGVTTRRIQDGKFLRITRQRPLVTVGTASKRTYVEYTGDVWCPSTQNQTWFARRNGKSFFTGNSNAIAIDESLLKSHIEPLALLVCDALTVVYLRPSLRAAGLSQEEANKYVVWYDASEVTARPNKAEDSSEGYQRNLLSGEAWRREHGFGPEDAPSPEEIALRMLVDKGPVTPELAEALLTIIAPNVMQKVREASQASNPAPLPPEVAEALGAPPTPPNAESSQPPAEPTPPGTPGTGAPRDNTVPGLNGPTPGTPAQPIDAEDLV